MLSIDLGKIEYPYAYSEELKQLRTNIEFSGSDKKVILMTSAYSQEGKSTLCLDLCRSFAELGKSVLLIDADMRLSTLANKRQAGSPVPKGLSHLLSGQTAMDNVLYQTNTPHFYTIFAGRVPPNPTELLSNKKMSSLISWARANFDIIFIDCPPIRIVADASVIAPLADGALVVIKSNIVSRKAALDVIKQLQRVNCPILGVVLSQSKNHKKRGSGYYYSKNNKKSS